MARIRMSQTALATFSFGLLLALWSIATLSGLIAEVFLPSPYTTAKALCTLFLRRHFFIDVAISTSRILAGFLIATFFGVPSGIIIGLSKRAQALVEPPFEFIRYTPIPAFIPLFILWFGVGELEKVVVIAFSIFFQIALMVANSVSLTPLPIIESAQTLGVTRWKLVTRVVYPFSRPKILDDLRVSMGWAWAVLTLAEIVGSTSGIGFVIIQSQRLLRTADVIAAIVVVGVLGLLTDSVFKWTYTRHFPWASKAHQHVRA